MAITNKIRGGRFTSSEIVALTKMGSRKMDDAELARHKAEFPKSRKTTIESWPGEAALTYIEETNMERRLCRYLDNDTDSKPTSWGNLVEAFVFEQLGLDYTLCSQETQRHPDIDYWCGSADSVKHDEGKTVCDIKCPFTLKSFCRLVQPLYDGLAGMDAMDRVRETHKDGDKYYWQLVSNSIINGCRYAELIVFMPYASEVELIKQLAEGQPHLYWLNFAQDGQLPYINDGGYYRSLNIIRFEVPQSDKDFLTDCVKKGGELLIPFEK